MRPLTWKCWESALNHLSQASPRVVLCGVHISHPCPCGRLKAGFVKGILGGITYDCTGRTRVAGGELGGTPLRTWVWSVGTAPLVWGRGCLFVSVPGGSRAQRELGWVILVFLMSPFKGLSEKPASGLGGLHFFGSQRWSEESPSGWGAQQQASGAPPHPRARVRPAVFCVAPGTGQAPKFPT